MKVFKFGGASVKDAAAVRNVLQVLGMYSGESLVVIISAMGKTTNALELVWQAWQSGHNAVTQLHHSIVYHRAILDELFTPGAAIFEKVETYWADLQSILDESPSDDRDYDYDRIVSFGELISTLIVSEFLNENGYPNLWLDAREVVKTDDFYREARLDWERTVTAIREVYDDFSGKTIITQGFIGRSETGDTTTLGREGSDYSAAIFGFSLNAESVTIWKDVPGMLNADPKFFENTQQLPQISFKEAIELSYYGASVIHPKTLKPLQNAGIPLFIKSFLNPGEPGTIIQESSAQDSLIPSYIFKTNQVLISISPRDFSFIVEENLSIIFAMLAKERVRINMMQNSALSFSICVNQDEQRIAALIAALSPDYQVLYNEPVTLITVRHYTEQVISQLTEGKKILVEQRSRSTARFVVSG
jgi:aspartate kinase